MVKVRLNTISDVQNFCRLSSSLYGDVDIISGKYMVNGKSILGLFSLDLSNPVEVIVHEVVPSEEIQFESQLKNLGLVVEDN